MSVGLLGRKVGMTQVYGEDGTAVPVTVIEVGPCVVLQIRTPERDGYSAIQLGFGEKPRRLAIRAERGHVTASVKSKRAATRAANKVDPVPKAECEPPRYTREIRLAPGEEWKIKQGEEEVAPKVGDKLTVDFLAEADFIDITGLIKGRGTAGVMKQHNFHGLRASHGVQRHHRAGGSIASHATNRGHSGRIKKGKKMSGRWGNERVTIRNLKLVKVDGANNLLLVRGGIPGADGGYVIVRRSRKKKSVQS
jgi:large subunit ribosomal protein L3